MDWEVFKELAKDDQGHRAERRQTAATQFGQAKTTALQHGMFLRRNTEAHYTLAAGAAGNYVWLWDLYPGKCRIKKSRHHPATPFLPGLALPWTLLDVVQAAIRLQEGDTQAKEK